MMLAASHLRAKRRTFYSTPDRSTAPSRPIHLLGPSSRRRATVPSTRQYGCTLDTWVCWSMTSETHTIGPGLFIVTGVSRRQGMARLTSHHFNKSCSAAARLVLQSCPRCRGAWLLFWACSRRSTSRREPLPPARRVTAVKGAAGRALQGDGAAQALRQCPSEGGLREATGSLLLLCGSCGAYQCGFYAPSVLLYASSTAARAAEKRTSLIAGATRIISHGTPEDNSYVSPTAP